MVAILNPKDMINTELDLSTAIKEIGILTQSNIELKETKEGLVKALKTLSKSVRDDGYRPNTPKQRALFNATKELKKHKQS